MGQKENPQSTSAIPTVAITLSKRKKTLVTLGFGMLLLFSSSGGSAVAVLQSVILTNMNAMQYFALLSVSSTIGLALMTPVGSKLGDAFGRKLVVMVSGVICIVCLIGIAFAKSFIPFLFFRTLMGFAQGAFIATPYIYANLINERKDVPKIMGLFSIFISVGMMAGPLIAGMLGDMGYIEVATSFSALFVMLGLIFLGIAMPESKSTQKPSLDWKGIVLLALLIVFFVIPLSYGGQIGWGSPLIIGGLAIMVLLLIVFIRFENNVEKKGSIPIISMRLFKNVEYTTLLIIGIGCFFYMNPMASYGALAAIQVLGAPATIAGSLLLPRTIIIMVLSVFTGAWVSKRTGQSWLAIAIAAFLIMLAFVPLIFVNSSMSIAIFFFAFAATGVAESFRAVSITPTAQEILDPQDLAMGTSLINFANTMANVFASAVSGALYNSFNKGGTDIAAGVRPVFGLAAVFALLALLLAIFVLRKCQQSRIVPKKLRLNINNSNNNT